MNNCIKVLEKEVKDLNKALDYAENKIFELKDTVSKLTDKIEKYREFIISSAMGGKV